MGLRVSTYGDSRGCGGAYRSERWALIGPGR